MPYLIINCPIIICEIDCRHDEGILPAVAKLGRGLEDLVQETVTGYVNWFLEINKKINHGYNFSMYLRPYNNSLSQKLNCDVALVVIYLTKRSNWP